MKITNQTILITGGAAGIGLALSKKFLQLGNRVIAVGRNEQRLKQLQATYPDRVLTYQCDVSELDKLQELATNILTQHPHVSVLINNAGIQHMYSFLNEEKHRALIEEEVMINITAPITLTSLLIPLLKKQEEAAIVNVSSGLGLVPKQSAPVYCGTKAGIHLFTKALRYQLEDTNIHVFEVIPPVVDTEMTKGRGKNKMTPEQLTDEFIKNFKSNHYEMEIGKVKLLTTINRWFPSIAEKILKKM
ncbi:SDR family oxidoreductase [Alkalihalobacillus hemicellulosilyticus]|uniref:Short-chain dehydrogenase/reductase SDR n=1 Tax=Halalkalibacter hemicellulosilyticusJCM 9152 TaxID=1236971 RepID=W4QD91_9BACI|nr:SDR family oxidoreductase [Halalkalibacter hemicellulosilyticus]GAE29653.1 short-chain dehydrogenase/reductase SDR [Halalkalibacter hemicellulosilyticusJCM 9152]